RQKRPGDERIVGRAELRPHRFVQRPIGELFESVRCPAPVLERATKGEAEDPRPPGSRWIVRFEVTLDGDEDGLRNVRAIAFGNAETAKRIPHVWQLALEELAESGGPCVARGNRERPRQQRRSGHGLPATRTRLNVPKTSGVVQTSVRTRRRVVLRR